MRFKCQLALAALVWLSRTIPSAIDTVETLEGFLRTVGVGRVAHPGELAVPDPVGGRVGGPFFWLKLNEESVIRVKGLPPIGI